MSTDFEYYLIGGDYKPTTPLLRDNDDEDEDTWFLVGSKPLSNKDIRTYKLCFNSPIPKNVVMTDYHSLPNSVFSRKIYDVLNGLNIFGIQLLPAEITHNKTKEVYSDYWIIYIYNKIQCLDMKNAKYKLDSEKEVSEITKLVLDKNILSKIPLEKRLVFSLQEDVSKYIYHKSVVDAIMSVNPTGIRFTPVEDWKG
jgi:hypothetical protein